MLRLKIKRVNLKWRKELPLPENLEEWVLRRTGYPLCHVYIQRSSRGYFIAVGSIGPRSKTFVARNIATARKQAMQWVEEEIEAKYDAFTSQ